MEKHELESLKRGIEELRISKTQDYKDSTSKHLTAIIESELLKTPSWPIISEKTCSICGKRDAEVVGTICDKYNCVRNRKNSDYENYKKAILVYPEYQKGYVFPLRNSPYPDAIIPLQDSPYPERKSHKDFIDETLDNLDGSVNEYEAFLPDTDRILFEKDCYKGLKLIFSEKIPMHHVYIKRKINS